MPYMTQLLRNFLKTTPLQGEPLPTSALSKKEKIKTRPSSDDDYDYENILEDTDPQKIHRYFQRLSKKEIKNNILYQANKNFGWVIDNQKIVINFTQVKQINPRCFAVIHPDLKAKLGSDLSMWEGCLDKGYARSKESCSGIKYLKEKDIYELKYTATGDRLVATVIYTNEQGNKLILFDHLATHKEIERMSDCARLQHIICSNWDA